jgi:hypothetical protein
MRLTDVARIFCNGALELHGIDVTWTAFKNAFYQKFRDEDRSIPLYPAADS